MDMEELEIVVRKDGTVSIAVKGVAGARCLAVTKGLEDAVGTLFERTFSAAYYEKEVRSEERILLPGRKKA